MAVQVQNNEKYTKNKSDVGYNNIKKYLNMHKIQR